MCLRRKPSTDVKKVGFPMRRACSYCAGEYRLDHPWVTAQVGEHFLMACSASCLCGILHTTSLCDGDPATLPCDTLSE